MSHNLDFENKTEELKESAARLRSSAVELKEKIEEKAEEAASEIKSEAKSKMARMKAKAHDMQEKAHDMASDLHDKTDRSIHELGERMERAAGKVRGKAPRLAHRLESGGKFLQENGIDQLSDRATGVIRQHPVEAMVIGLGIGVLLGSLLSSRRNHA